jgi:DNA polymerase I-like protein with 3'-5' exonuclease and polymerase domains
MILNPNTKEAYDLFHDGTIALAKAEMQGMRFDKDVAEKSKEMISKKIKILEKIIYNSKFYQDWQSTSRTKVNIYSNQQLAEYLYDHLQLTPTKYTATNKGSTDEKTLKEIEIPEIQTLLKIRKLKKIRDTYLDSFEREVANGFIHPSYNLNIARTFRSSSNNPNFQNVPKRDPEAYKYTRSCLFPRKGHLFLEVDYGQLEVRIAACYNKDPQLIDDIIHGDMHRDMAVEIYKIKGFDKSIKGHSTLRKGAKNGFVFPEFYGDYYKNCVPTLACDWGELPKNGKWKSGQGIIVDNDIHLSDHLFANGIKNLNQFSDHVKKIEYNFWNKRYNVYTDWKEEWWQEYLKNGYLYTKTGFTCSGLMSRNDVINYPVQGAAFHCLLWSFNRMSFLLEYYKMDTKLIGQIHDSIILDVNPKELDQVREMIYDVTTVQLPKAWPWIDIPLDVDAEIGEVDASWDTMVDDLNFGRR